MNKKHNFQLTFDKKNQIGDYLIFSLPQTNHYQIINNLSIFPKSYEILNEEKWGNRILIQTLNDVIDFNISFKHTGKTINKGINKQLTKIIFSQYQQTIDKLTYGNPIDGLYSYKQVLENPITDCGGFSTFLIYLLNSVNIKARLVVGFIIKSNFSLFPLNFKSLLIHAWVEALLPDNTWFPMDPSIEWRRLHGLSTRFGGFGFIPNDRLIVSFGENFEFLINNKKFKTEILQKPIIL